MRSQKNILQNYGMFPIVFCMAYLLVIMNMDVLVKFANSNSIEKSFFLLTCIVGVMTRRVDFFAISILIVQILICIFLATQTTYPDFRWGIFFAALNQIIIIYLFVAINPTEKDSRVILSFVSFLPLISIVVGSIYQVMGVYTLTAVEYATGLPRWRASTSSAAYLSALSMCGVYAALQTALHSNKRYYLIFINFMILLLAGGRAALATALLLMITTIALSPKISFVRKIRMATLSLAGGALVGALFWGRIMKRFEESGDSGRGPMWEYLLSVADAYPNTGIGFGHQYFAVPDYIVRIFTSAAAHNDYIRLSLELGYPGAWIFYILLGLVVLRAACRYGNPLRSPVLIAFGGYLLLSRSDNSLASPVEFIIIFLAILAQIPQTKVEKRRRGVLSSPVLSRPTP